MLESPFKWKSIVRDYELDSQGIVNNATYLNYFEQCRSNFVRSFGIDVHEYYKAGYSLVVAAIEIRYKRPLRALDEFYVTASIASADRKRVIFNQEIRHCSDDKLNAVGSVQTVCVDNKTGRACMPEMLVKHLSEVSPKIE